MRDTVRRESARLRAEAYAPAPRDSRLLYGAISGTLLLLAIAAVAAFYAIDVWQQPLAILGLAGLAAGAGLLFRIWRKRRHDLAHRKEYEFGEACNDLG